MPTQPPVPYDPRLADALTKLLTAAIHAAHGRMLDERTVRFALATAVDDLTRLSTLAFDEPGNDLDARDGEPVLDVSSRELLQHAELSFPCAKPPHHPHWWRGRLN